MTPLNISNNTPNNSTSKKSGKLPGQFQQTDIVIPLKPVTEDHPQIGTFKLVDKDKVKNHSEIGWVQCGFLDARVWIVYTGCTKIGKNLECEHCWAEDVAEMRKHNRRQPKYKEGFHKVVVHEFEFDQPLKWKHPSLVFVNSESDTFHEAVSDDVIIRLFQKMNSLPEHTFQVLTKRPNRLLKMLDKLILTDNIWIGVTCGHRSSLRRLDILRKIPAKVRWISVEPLLQDLADEMNLDGIDWVIIGGERTKKFDNARPMAIEWARKFQIKCESLEIPFFMKQWGTVGPDGVRRHTSANGNLIDGVKYEQFPRFLYEYYGVVNPN
jgi:protein gp37